MKFIDNILFKKKNQEIEELQKEIDRLKKINNGLIDFNKDLKMKLDGMHSIIDYYSHIEEIKDKEIGMYIEILKDLNAQINIEYDNITANFRNPYADKDPIKKFKITDVYLRKSFVVTDIDPKIKSLLKDISKDDNLPEGEHLSND